MTSDFEAQAVLSQLGRGRDAAEPLGAIAERLNWPRRQVEQAINDLRHAGHPVASGAPGVWLGDARDLEETYRYLRGRIVSQSVTAWAVRATLRRMRSADIEQIELFPAA